MYENYPYDIQQFLNSLKHDGVLTDFEELPISKKLSKSYRLIYLEELLLKHEYTCAEDLYISAMKHWGYIGEEAKDITNGKKGTLVGEFEYDTNIDMSIYQIEIGKNLKFIMMYKKVKTITAYINVAIENKLMINKIWNNTYSNDIIKLFLEKWFIPKYNLNITSEEVDKLLKEVK